MPLLSLCYVAACLDLIDIGFARFPMTRALRFRFNLANAVFGGTALLVATALISLSGDQPAAGWYLVLAALVALVTMLVSRETARRPLET